MNINNIIQESIKMVITEKADIPAMTLNDIRNLLKKYKGKGKNDMSKEDLRQKLKLKKKYSEKNKKKGSKRTRKLKNGGKMYYDYNSYEQSNRKLSKADADSIRLSINMDTADIASIARKIFPKHTDEGAQSQLRKILNGERPMTKPVASKLQKMISRGQIPVK